MPNETDPPPLNFENTPIRNPLVAQLTDQEGRLRKQEKCMRSVEAELKAIHTGINVGRWVLGLGAAGIITLAAWTVKATIETDTEMVQVQRQLTASAETGVETARDMRSVQQKLAGISATLTGMREAQDDAHDDIRERLGNVEDRLERRRTQRR